MKYTMLFIYLLIIIIFVSGCVGKLPPIVNYTNSTESQNVSNLISNASNMSDTSDIITISNISNITLQSVNNSNNTMSYLKSQYWCLPKSNVVFNSNNYVVEGITNYQGKEVCKAKFLIKNGETVRYWTEDNKFIAEVSSSSSNGSSAYSSSSVSH